MRLPARSAAAIAAIIMWSLASTRPAPAASLQVLIDTAAIAHITAELAWDFIDGGPPSNSVAITAFSTDGILGAQTRTGNVYGSLPGTLTLSDESFFNELLTGITLGTMISFVFTPTSNAAVPGSLADSLSVFLLDSTSGLPLFGTADPTGADALFRFDIEGGLGVFAASVEVSPVPEPSTIWLIGGVLLVALASRVRWRSGLPCCAIGLICLLTIKAPYAAAQSQVSVNDRVSVVFSGIVLNRTTATYDSVATITNKSQDTIGAPLMLALTRINPAGVTLANVAGHTSDGKPFVAVPIPGGALRSGATVTNIVLKFSNPDRVSFTFMHSVLGFFPAPQDPCQQVTVPCASLLMGSVVIFSTQQNGIISTSVRESTVETFAFDWVPAASNVMFNVKTPEGPTLPYREFPGQLPTLQQANVVAGVVTGLNSTPLSGNSAGCDVIGDWSFWENSFNSCGPKGSCCDTHDLCLHNRCRGNNGPYDSGDLRNCLNRYMRYRLCLLSPQIYPGSREEYCRRNYPTCSSECDFCHSQALQCFLDKSRPPEASKCCLDEGGRDPSICGQPQECITDDGKVLTDPCACVAARKIPLNSCNACTPPNDGSCKQGGAIGDTHLITLDRLAYDFQAVGEFVLVRSNQDDLEIQTRKRPWGNSRVVSVNTAAAVSVAGDRVGVYLGRTPAVYVNGVPTNVQSLVGLPKGGSVHRSGNSVEIVWPDRSSVRMDMRGSYIDLSVKLPASRRGRVRGLLGNADDNSANDFAIRNGAVLPGLPSFNELYKQYGESWRVSPNESLFDYAPGETASTYTDRTFPSGIVTTASLADAVRARAEQTCRSRGVSDPILLEACILDVGLTGDDSFAESALGAPLPRTVAHIDTTSAGWDAALQYSRATNPAGAWSYGRKPAVEGNGFVLMTVPWGDSGWYSGNVGHGGPSIQGGPQLWSKNNTNGFAAVRWTSPKSDVYDIQGVFTGADPRGVGNFAYLVLKGIKVADGQVNGYGGIFPFAHTAFIEQGQHLDFVVVWNSQSGVNSEYGWTQLSTFVMRAPNTGALVGQSRDNPAKSCLEIRQLGLARGNGNYWIRLPSGVFQMHCNFSADTGGWTRVGALDTTTGFCGTGAVPDLRLNVDAGTGKIPDTDAQALMRDTPRSPMELMYVSRTDGRYVWHSLENISDFDTSSKHSSSRYYCTNWHCDNGTTDASACGTEGEGCPVTAHGIGGFTKKIYVDSAFARHIQGLHVNGNMCGLQNYERASVWIYVR